MTAPGIDRLDDKPMVRIQGGGLTASILARGAILQDLRIDGVAHSLVLGSPHAQAYDGPMAYFGAIVGPVANRIAGGSFDLNGATHALDRNERGKTTLHGGADGFAAQDWRFEAVHPDRCTLVVIHRDGQGGFPGPITARVTYSLPGDGTLCIDITGDTPKDTVFSPAFHGYWCLDGSASLEHHVLQVDAASYLALDGDKIPTQQTPVVGTAFDYRQGKRPAATLDHNFCLNHAFETDRSADPTPIARITTPTVSMTLATSAPGLQVYTAGGMQTAPWAGHGGTPYTSNAGIALEPQGWPNAVNRPDFPPVLLAAGQPAHQRSVFRFSRSE